MRKSCSWCNLNVTVLCFSAPGARRPPLFPVCACRRQRCFDSLVLPCSPIGSCARFPRFSCNPASLVFEPHAAAHKCIVCSFWCILLYCKNEKKKKLLCLPPRSLSPYLLTMCMHANGVRCKATLWVKNRGGGGSGR